MIGCSSESSNGLQHGIDAGTGHCRSVHQLEPVLLALVLASAHCREAVSSPKTKQMQMQQWFPLSAPRRLPRSLVLGLPSLFISALLRLLAQSRPSLVTQVWALLGDAASSAVFATSL